MGPVYRFSPLDPDRSHKYSPLSFVDRDPCFIWRDSRSLGNMMIVPRLADDPFWENEARLAVTTAIAYVCYFNPPEQRPMNAVLKVMFDRKAWDDMILKLAGVVDVPELPRNASALAQQNDQALRCVLQVARSSLSAWSGSLIEGVTSKSDWSPDLLRDGSNSTVYICITPDQVESYLSVLRVFIGQHIRMLIGGPLPPTPILFMLDELPRLRNMPPGEEALWVGKNRRLRLWMFAQSVGQLRTAHEHVDDMLFHCAVRIYMNPST